jgi:hypothetical protein
MFKAAQSTWETKSDFISKSPAEIKKGIVVEVYSDRGTCDVRTLDIRSSFYGDIPYATGYLGPDGNGMDICPEVGSYCYFIATDSASMNPKDARYTQATIFCFMSPRSDNTSLGTRSQISPGDIRMTAGSGEVLLRNNGDMYLFSGPSIGTAFLSTRALMQTIAPSYVLNTMGGSIKWITNSDIQGGPTDFTAVIKKSATDEQGYVTISAGDANNGTFSVSVQDTGSNDSTNIFDLRVFTDSQPTTLFAGNGLEISTGTGPLSLNGRVIVEQTSLNINLGNASVLLENDEASKMTINADEIVINTSKPLVINMDGEEIVRLEKDTLKKLVTEFLIPWIKTHTHANAPVDAAQLQALELLIQNEKLITKSKLS